MFPLDTASGDIWFESRGVTWSDIDCYFVIFSSFISTLQTEITLLSDKENVSVVRKARWAIGLGHN